NHKFRGPFSQRGRSPSRRLPMRPPPRWLVPPALLFFALPAHGRDRLPAQVAAVLDKAEKVELLSLVPEEREEERKRDFHGYPVLGKTTLKKEDRQKVLNALKKGIADSDGRVATCFNPRHGIRASHGGKTVELLICFECLQVDVYAGGKPTSVL